MWYDVDNILAKRRNTMTELFLRSIFSSILWIQIMYIPSCDCMAITKSTTENPEIVGEIRKHDKMMNLESRKFPSTNVKAIKLQSFLHYNEKPFWPMQWIMNEETFIVSKKRYSPSMNIAAMHCEGIKGKEAGVVIIGNSKVNCLHEEIKNRCHAQDTINTLSKHPQTFISREFSVGPSDVMIPSEVAGIIGMSDESKSGGVGIAPQCVIGSIEIISSSKFAAPEYYATKIISKDTQPLAEVFIHVWIRPSYNFQRDILEVQYNLNLLNFSNRKARKAHVMGSGMYGIFANSCQCNQYAIADSMFVFGSIGYDGYLLPFSETCASLIGVTYSASIGESFFNNIVTISSAEPHSFVFATKNRPSSSAAVAGGVIALIVDLFKRKFSTSPTISDLAFLLALSSNSNILQNKNTLWFSNGIGLKYSQQAGFGLPDMLAVFQYLDTWTPMEFPYIYEPKTDSLTYMNNMICDFTVDNKVGDYYIQLVNVQLSAELKKRGSLSIYLISPAGTISCILEGRPFDMETTGYTDLILRSNHFLGETSNGKWSIRFYVYKEDSNPDLELMASAFPKEENNNQLPDVDEHYNGDDDDNSALYDREIFVTRDVVNPSNDEKLTTLRDKKSVRFSNIDKILEAQENPTQAKDNENLQDSTIPLDRLSSLRRVSSFKSSDREAITPVKKKLNIIKVKQLKFRFVLHRTLPSVRILGQTNKSIQKISQNFELLKAWVDFRHFLLAKLDPQSDNYLELDKEEVFELLNMHVKQLISIQ